MLWFRRRNGSLCGTSAVVVPSLAMGHPTAARPTTAPYPSRAEGETATTVRERARLVFGAHEQPTSSRSRAAIGGWPRRGGGVRDRTAVGRATAREVGVVKASRSRETGRGGGRPPSPTPPRGPPPWRLRVRGSARRPLHISFGSLVLGCQSRPTRQRRFRGHHGLHYGQCSQRANREEAYRSLKGPHVSQTHTLRRRRTQPPPRSG
jgi:hypothetical protein